MNHAEQLLFVGICGAVAGLIVGIGIHDWSMAAHAGEKMACRDEPDKRAFMIRQPGEAHSTEYCAKIMRYGSPDWVPEFKHPLGPRKDSG